MNERWYYFLTIEKDFIRTLDFAHLHPTNASTFSNEYAKLLLIIGSEVDVVAKMLCQRETPGQSANNIGDYRTILTARFVGLPTIEIDIPRYGRSIKPWDTWGAPFTSSPGWWRAYNEVKHDRDQSFQQASQSNVLSGLCGLMSLLLYWFKDETYLQPFPELLNYGFPEFLTAGGGKKPPGV